MSWDWNFRSYVSAGEKRRRAEKAAKALEKKGRRLNPIRLDGQTIARSFWGKAWCANLESYSDFANRLPRGRAYVRNGSVVDFQIAPGVINALVEWERPLPDHDQNSTCSKGRVENPEDRLRRSGRLAD